MHRCNRLDKGGVERWLLRRTPRSLYGSNPVFCSIAIELYRQKFGDYLPLIRRQDVKGFITKKALWLMQPLNLDEVRKFAENMEFEAARFYRKAAETTRDASVRKLLVELAEAEVAHESLAHKLEQKILTPDARAEEDETARRVFLLQYVQPGLVGLMDGSVSTLAPLFAAAFATHNTWETFLVGLAASVGAGISMGFAEALSDDGSLTGFVEDQSICVLEAGAVVGEAFGKSLDEFS
jgi:rubrerythrin